MEQTKIEKYLEATLLEKLGNEKGKNYYSDYQSARKYLFEEITPNIKGIEPNLTDHSEKHIENVLDNVWRLLTIKDNEIKTEKGIEALSCYELYVLCLSVLFHDVGNINGRNNHNIKISNIYDKVRNNNTKYNSERALILKATKAHCGEAKDGTRDTLKELDRSCQSLSGEPIQLLDIASILRFADELAEGPQRTSDYMIDKKKFKKKSIIYNRYAQIIDVLIDRGNERVVLTYRINIKGKTKKELTELLQFTYERIIKLDEERKYTKFYSQFLTPFKQTEITFDFRKGEKDIEIEGLKKIILSDTYVIPGANKSNANDLISQFAALNIDKIINQLNLKK
jgi:hypothetical protein